MNGINNSLEKPGSVPDAQQNEENKNVKRSTVREKLMHIRANITVEPIIACYIMSNVFSGLAVQNLNLEKACRVNLGYSDEICSALNRRQTLNYTSEEAEVQKLTASVQAWKNIVQTAFPCILVLFVGSWSDKTGKRKACILLPIVGEILSCTSFILNTYFFYELPLELTALSDLFPSLTGGWITVCVGVFSYIGDVTTKEMRTFRVGVANLCMSLGIPIGMSLSGVLLQQIGYYGIFLISNCLYMMSLLYGYIRLKDPKLPEDRQREKPRGCRGWMCSFFDARHVRETLTVAFKSGPRRRRLRVSLLIVVVCVIFGPLHGEMNVLYLFMRYRFNWDEVQFSMFCTYSIITNLVGTLFSISIFSDFMKLDDSVVGIISCTSKILASFIFAFATTTAEIYIGPLVEIFNGTSFIAMRSIASKLVSSEELDLVWMGALNETEPGGYFPTNKCGCFLAGIVTGSFTFTILFIQALWLWALGNPAFLRMSPIWSANTLLGLPRIHLNEIYKFMQEISRLLLLIVTGHMTAPRLMLSWSAALEWRRLLLQALAFLGKVNSLFGLAEAMMPLVYGPLYSRVYMATLNVLPGAVFLLGAAMTVPAVAIFGYWTGANIFLILGIWGMIFKLDSFISNYDSMEELLHDYIRPSVYLWMYFEQREDNKQLEEMANVS